VWLSWACDIYYLLHLPGNFSGLPGAPGDRAGSANVSPRMNLNPLLFLALFAILLLAYYLLSNRLMALSLLGRWASHHYLSDSRLEKLVHPAGSPPALRNREGCSSCRTAAMADLKSYLGNGFRDRLRLVHANAVPLHKTSRRPATMKPPHLEALTALTVFVAKTHRRSLTPQAFGRPSLPPAVSWARRT